MRQSRASQVVNPWIGVAFIADNTRMEVPPAWFLQRLHDYDADLVMLPSKMRPFAYVLARRMRMNAERAMDQTITQLDTKMCFKYGLVPVCLIFKHGSAWKVDGVIASLKARDLWRQADAIPGSSSRGDKIADMLEASEAQDVEDRRKAKREELYHLSGEAYRTYKTRTGQRVPSTGVDPSRFGAATKSSSSGTATGVTLT